MSFLTIFNENIFSFALFLIYYWSLPMLYIPELYIGFLLSNLHKKNIFYSTLIQTTAKTLKVLYYD